MAKPKIKGIYAIDINGKKYIGQDSAIFKNNRLITHISNLRRNIHHNECLQSDFNEFGEENFTYTILTFSDSYEKEDLNRLEKQFIEKYKTFDSEYGYNQTTGGIGMQGFVFSEETLLKKSENVRGEKNPQSKITNDQFFEIVGLIKRGASNDEIGEKYNLHTRYVSLIRHKKRFKSLWDLIDDYSPIQSHSLKDKRKLNYEDFKDIVNMLNKGETNAAIEKKYKLSSGTGSRIRNKKLYADYWDRHKKEIC